MNTLPKVYPRSVEAFMGGSSRYFRSSSGRSWLFLGVPRTVSGAPGRPVAGSWEGGGRKTLTGALLETPALWALQRAPLDLALSR